MWYCFSVFEKALSTFHAPDAVPVEILVLTVQQDTPGRETRRWATNQGKLTVVAPSLLMRSHVVPALPELSKPYIGRPFKEAHTRSTREDTTPARNNPSSSAQVVP